MSKIAILTDIHANLPALVAVLCDVEASEADQIVFLGDIVGYGGSPAECVDWVRRHGGICVMGNHDVEIRDLRQPGFAFGDPDWKESGYQAGLAHAAKCLDADQADWLAALPLTMEIPGAFAAHGSLVDPEAFDYLLSAEDAMPTLEILRTEEVKVAFVGHTHVPDIFADGGEALEWLDGTRVRIPLGIACVVTVGSVGQAYDGTDRRAAWVMWDPDENVVEFRKTVYDWIRAVEDRAAAGLPV